MSQIPDDIDWSVTTWEGARREHLRRTAALTLREHMQSLEDMAEVAQRFREMRETGKFSAAPRSGHAASPPSEAHVPLEPTTEEADNATYGLEASNQALARAPAGGAGPHPPQPDSPERGREHGVRGGAGGPADAGGGTRPPHGATRTIETSLGVLAYSELAPHLARNVQELEERIEDGEFAGAALDDRLVLEFHRLICADLVPRFAGWRRVNVTVGEHTPPDFFRVSSLVREYGLDLHVRLSALIGHDDERMVETLAFAEGRLLSIHPFADFNGRVTRVWLREIIRRLHLPPVRLAPVEATALHGYLSALSAADRNDWRPLMSIWRQRFEQALA
jgi:CRISPR-associated endonuclease/helicase Cas3